MHLLLKKSDMNKFNRVICTAKMYCQDEGSVYAIGTYGVTHSYRENTTRALEWIRMFKGPALSYQLAACKACSWLVLRLLYIFHVCLYLGL